MGIRTHITSTLVAVTAALAIAPAQAAPLQLSYSLTSNNGSNVVASTGVTTGLAVPGSYTYGFTHGALDEIIAGSVSTRYPDGFEFYDDFVFTIAAASANAITSTISFADILGISDLQVRLYNAAGQGSLPVIGAPVGGAIEAWSNPISAGATTGTVAVLSNSVLSAGTYVLEIRGNVSGSAGGSYSGSLNVAPVPVPGALILFGSALSGVLAARRRRAV